MSARPFPGLRAAPLDRQARSLMERGFGEDFGKVRVSVREGRGGPSACTVGEHIVFAAGWYQPRTWPGRLVLAHELAHVVQKRHGADRPGLPPAPADLLEAEAHAAAAVVAGGGRFRCSLPDRPAVPRFWEEEGHYYTSYLVMLAAGIDGQIAQQSAQYAQMPDEIEELDAAGWGKKVYNLDGWVAGGNRRGIPEPMAGYLLEKDELVQKARTTPAPTPQQMLTPEEWKRFLWLKEQLTTGLREHMLNIQIGLHCLSGRRAAEETRARAHRLLATEPGSVQCGLAIHAFGDSFSHRNRSDETLMYSSGLGHAVDLFKIRDPHAADHIHVRPELYCKYGLALYHIMCKKAAGRKRLLEREPLGNKLYELARIPEKPEQVRRMRQFADEMKTPMVRMTPENNVTLYIWEEYKWEFGIPPTFLDEALKLAKAWRPVHSPELEGGDSESVDPALPDTFLRDKARRAEFEKAMKESVEIGRRKPGEL